MVLFTLAAGEEPWPGYGLQMKMIAGKMIVKGCTRKRGAKGADSLGERYARDNDLKIKRLVPHWKKYGKAAAIFRNTDIVKAADWVIAFWDGTSRGTKDTIAKARKDDKLFKIVKCPTHSSKSSK